jgi:hypothetical protein
MRNENYDRIQYVMKNTIFLDVTPHLFCKSRRFEETYCLHHQGDNSQSPRNNIRSNSQLKYPVNKYYVLQEPHGVTSQKVAFS